MVQKSKGFKTDSEGFSVGFGGFAFSDWSGVEGLAFGPFGVQDMRSGDKMSS